jgi:hypothetical protein
MKELKEEQSLIIKPADKGGCIVLMNKVDYIAEGNRQLQNLQHYRKLNHNPTEQYNKEINTIINQACQNNVINTKTKTHLITKFPRTPNFYLLPKIHKQNNPGRPIVNSIQSPTEKISAFVDETLKPLARKVDSYIKDTTDFLNMIKDIPVDENDILVTIDVSALYTNIPHDEGVQAIKEWMTENQIETEKINLLCELANKVLKCNYFEFDNQLYLQVQGTAMGTRMAPNYAIIFMHQLEKKLLQRSQQKPTIWKRFIDDVFCIWSHGEDSLLEFLNELNTYHQTIKFTWEYSHIQIPFLDTVTYKLNGMLATKIYHKPTDNKQYLHFYSAHPRRQKESVPNGLFLRAKRICTEDHHFEAESGVIMMKLKNRCYPEDLLNTVYNKVKLLKREDLLEPTVKIDNEDIRYITNFNPNNPNPSNIIYKFADTLYSTRKPAIFPHQLKVTYSRSPNIKNMLISGYIAKKKEPRSCQPCGKPRCKTCNRITTNLVVTNTKNESFPIRGNFTCQSHNVVYYLKCNICGIPYVGETSNTLNTRCRGHESAIRTNQLHPVAKHFNTANHTPESYSITAIDRERDKNKRLRLEESWMILMDTLHPYGLNARM